MIERKIVIGLIVSKEYIAQIRKVWEPRFISSDMARTLALWCIEHYDKYKVAPGRDIEQIFLSKLKAKKIDKDQAEDFEQDILPQLNEEYEQDKFNLDYLLDKTFEYFNEQHIEQHQEQVQALMDRSQVDDATKLQQDFRPILRTQERDLDFSDPVILSKVRSAYLAANDPLITYPGVLGDFINPQLTRGSFVAFMAPEKRGKTWWLMDMANRALRQRSRVAFFQAGDMTEAQFIRREGIYLNHASDQERYTGDIWLPTRDCVKNQLDTCDRREREGDIGLFPEEKSEKEWRWKVTREKLVDTFDPDYKPCWNCKDYVGSKWGIPYIKPVNIPRTTGPDKAVEMYQKFFLDRRRKLRLSTHANGTLSVEEMRDTIAMWEQQDGFVPDVVIVDYADLLVGGSGNDFRQQQNHIWKSLRGLNQELHCLLITATQTDSKSYEKNRLDLSNYSEDKRKYAHATAFYGLNQDKTGREKRLGLLYLNELLLREGDFDTADGVYVLQSIQTGRPFMGSFK